jgi:hypothetical protein
VERSKSCETHPRRDCSAVAFLDRETDEAVPSFPNRPPRGPRTGKPLRLNPPLSCAACPGRALPCCAFLRPAAAGCRGALGQPPSPRAVAAGRGSRAEMAFVLPIRRLCPRQVHHCRGTQAWIRKDAARYAAFHAQGSQPLCGARVQANRAGGVNADDLSALRPGCQSESLALAPWDRQPAIPLIPE